MQTTLPFHSRWLRKPGSITIQLAALLITASVASAQLAPRWTSFTAQSMPSDALVGGTDSGNPTYVCRAEHLGGTHAGKASRGTAGCRIEYFGRGLLVTTNAEVLTNFFPHWQTGRGGSIPSGSYEVGREGAITHHSCRGYYNGTMTPGKVWASAPGCHIDYAGAAVILPEYEVLRNPWVTASGGTIPPGSTSTGTDIDGQPLYSCRGLVNSAVFIGKVRSVFTGCRVENFGRVTNIPSYDVLTGLSAAWVPVSNTNTVPSGAPLAGQEGGEARYICRGEIQGSKQPGKLTPFNACLFEFADATQLLKTYEVLVPTQTAFTETYVLQTKSSLRFAGIQAGQIFSTRPSQTITDSFRLTFARQADGSFRIRVAGDGLFLHQVSSGADTQVSTRFQPNDDSTRFFLEQEPEGSYRIRTKSHEFYWNEAASGVIERQTGAVSNSSRFFLAIAPAATNNAQRPSISEGGVVTVASQQTRAAALSLISIYGQNFSPSAPNGTDWGGQMLPTTLAGARVTIGGVPAYILFIKNDFMNVVVPDVPSGSREVIVTTANGASVARTIQIVALAPEFKTWSNNYVEALHSDGTPNSPPSYVAGQGQYPRSTPAKPGENISLWALGFGPSNPAQRAGIIAPNVPLPSAVTITVGGRNAQVSYAGLSGVGLYQLNITVPAELTDGDHEIVATYGGTRTQTGLRLPVRR